MVSRIRERDEQLSCGGLGGVEHRNDLGCPLGEGGQRVPNWPPIGERSFREAYIDAKLRICVRPSDYSPQWAAVFQFAGKHAFGFGLPSAPPPDGGGSHPGCG